MKLTRKSYNRRVFTFGIVMFLAIALISTGFAAFIMSNNATANEDGTINVGTITDGSIAFGEITFEGGDAFHFEPDATDNEGHVVYKDGNSENLTVKIKSSVSPAQYLKTDGITIKMTSIPESVVAAADAGYIVLPECYAAAQNVEYTVTDNVANFTYDISFEWGEKFNGKNPSVFLDLANAKDLVGDGTGAYTYEEKKEILVAFRRTIFGLESSMSESDVMSYEPAPGSELKYEFELSAEAAI